MIMDTAHIEGGVRTMKKIDVKLTHQILWGQSCTLCGDRIEEQQVQDDVLAQGHDSDAARKADVNRVVTVCAACLASDDISERIEQRAAWLRSLIGRLNLPAYADYQAAQDAIASATDQAIEQARRSACGE
jgi:hypothetical protein